MREGHDHHLERDHLVHLVERHEQLSAQDLEPSFDESAARVTRADHSATEIWNSRSRFVLPWF